MEEDGKYLGRGGGGLLPELLKLEVKPFMQSFTWKCSPEFSLTRGSLIGRISMSGIWGFI